MNIEIKKGIGYYKANYPFEHTYVNGIQHGIQKNFFPNNQKCGIWFHKNGQTHGISQYWKEDQSREFINQWKNRSLHGFKINFKYEN
jgi:antitoxin component YwqK of YwqJK toxin-antitoxin module